MGIHGLHLFSQQRLISPSKILDANLTVVVDSTLYWVGKYDPDQGLFPLRIKTTQPKYLDWRGRWLLPSSVSETILLRNGHFAVTVAGKMGITDRRGDLVYPPVFQTIFTTGYGNYRVTFPDDPTEYYLPYDRPRE